MAGTNVFLFSILTRSITDKKHFKQLASALNLTHGELFHELLMHFQSNKLAQDCHLWRFAYKDLYHIPHSAEDYQISPEAQAAAEAIEDGTAKDAEPLF